MGIQTVQLPDNMTLDEVERIYVRHVVSVSNGNKSEAARRLGVDRRTLYRYLAKQAG